MIPMRGAAWVTVMARRRIGDRHGEAAKRPKQSSRAGPRVMDGRRAVWPARFWIASPALRAGSQ